MKKSDTVTIGFCPRERFSKAPASLKSILDNTAEPFRLILVDCNTPLAIWSQIERLLQKKPDAEVIRLDHFSLPSACKNLIIDRLETDYLCLIENDILVSEEWIDKFIASSIQNEADVLIPLIFEIFEDRPAIQPRPHFDDDLGSVAVEKRSGEKYNVITSRIGSRFDDPKSSARVQELMEAHCLFFRRDLLGRMRSLDGNCNASDEIDISMAVREAGGKTVFDPQCVVTFVQPPFPVHPIDREYFLNRWDPQDAAKSHERLVQRWKLAHSPQLLGYWHERHARGGGTIGRWRDELALLSENQKVILVDGQEFHDSELISGLNVIPFMENEGVYWGEPADDDAAWKELNKQRKSGARLIVFTWNSFWYFSYYEEFFTRLKTSFKCVLSDQRMVVFDLCPGRTAE